MRSCVRRLVWCANERLVVSTGGGTNVRRHALFIAPVRERASDKSIPNGIKRYRKDRLDDVWQLQRLRLAVRHQSAGPATARSERRLAASLDLCATLRPTAPAPQPRPSALLLFAWLKPAASRNAKG